MKDASLKTTLLLATVAMLLASIPVRATTIGPDAHGYTATDQAQYNFVDIRSTGTTAFNGYSDDGSRGPINIGFSFDFYGNSYSTLYVSSNGMVSFGSGNTAYANTDLTTNANPTQAVIVPYWDDLVVDPNNPTNGNVYYETLGNPGSRQFVVEWYVRRIAQHGTELLFEAILYEGSNDILFQYQDVIGSSFSNGESATVGIRDVNGQNSGNVLQWSFNQAVIENDQAILFPE